MSANWPAVALAVPAQPIFHPLSTRFLTVTIPLSGQKVYGTSCNGSARSGRLGSDGYPTGRWRGAWPGGANRDHPIDPLPERDSVVIGIINSPPQLWGRGTFKRIRFTLSSRYSSQSGDDALHFFFAESAHSGGSNITLHPDLQEQAGGGLIIGAF